jgi:hypothetical protein
MVSVEHEELDYLLRTLLLYFKETNFQERNPQIVNAWKQQVNNTKLAARINARKQKLRDVEEAAKKKINDEQRARDRILPKLLKKAEHKRGARLLKEFFPDSNVPPTSRGKELQKQFTKAMARLQATMNQGTLVSVETRVEAEELYKILNNELQRLRES